MSEPLSEPFSEPFSERFSDRSASRLSSGRQLLERCLAGDCDLDPLILRARLLRQRGVLALARCLEEELLPLF